METVEDAVSGEEVAVMTVAEAEHYEEIKKLNVLVNDAAREHDIKKSEAKSAKEHLEGLQCRLSCLISEGPKKPDPQKTLDFEAWRTVPIENVIEVTEKQLEKLNEGGIKTVIDFEVERGANRFAAIKGIGEKTIEKWEDEIIEWLSVNARETESESDDANNN